MKIGDITKVQELLHDRKKVLNLISQARDDDNHWDLVCSRDHDMDSGSLMLDSGVVLDILREELARIDDQLVDLGVELEDSTVALPAETE